MKNNTVLVIAFKFNDILYSISTEEFKQASYKKLLIVYAKGKSPEKFPLQHIFDEVIYAKYIPGITHMLINLWNIYKLREKLLSNITILSNPILLMSKLIFKLSKSKTAVWIEDGLMNYYPLSNIHYYHSRMLKKNMQTLLGISDIENYANHFVTYLLEPDMAVSFWGEKKRIIIHDELIKCLPVKNASFLQGKKIFVGQPFYTDGRIKLEEYNNVVNKIISEYNIDYYIPHYCASELENIDCNIIKLEDLNITLEFIACKYKFDLYSFNSTVLYSTKLLNNEINTYMIDYGGLGTTHSIILKTVNDVIKKTKS